jgi:hypothetical protein
MKLSRNFKLTVQPNGKKSSTNKDIVITPPFTIQFDITRNILSSLNVSTFRIYNLSEKNRARIRKDQANVGLNKNIEFLAGYGDELSFCFSGNVTRAYSVREGNNFITTIESFDGGFATVNATTSVEFAKNTTKKAAMITLMNKLSKFGIEKGKIGDIKGKFLRKTALSGNIIYLMNQIVPGATFIDNKIINVLGENEVLKSIPITIYSKSGLLQTPSLDLYNLTFDTILETKIQIGQKIKLISDTEKGYNAYYKIMSLKHRGIISESISGTAITTMGMYYGNKKLEDAIGF